VVCLVLAVLGLFMVATAPPAGQWLGEKFGVLILKMGKGKIADPHAFARLRLREAGVLVIAGALLMAAGSKLTRLLERRWAASHKSWITLALFYFAALNIWLLIAMKTALFWGIFYHGEATLNLTLIEFKKALLNEVKVPRQVILMGSSQTRAQIDENQLNEKFRDSVWTTELHFPGSGGVDLLLVGRHLRSAPPADVICYLSEQNFFGDMSHEAVPFFLTISDIATLGRIQMPLLSYKGFWLGMLGEMMPLFRCRGPLSQLVFGASHAALAQSAYDSRLETNLVRRAEKTASQFSLGPSSDLEKRAFLAFIEEMSRQNRHVTLLEGQLNPILGQRLDPAIRRDMKSFLREVARRYSHVTIVFEELLPNQSPDQYLDLTHVNEAAQTQFSTWLAENLFSKPASKAGP
jgi:hypothetical protein